MAKSNNIISPKPVRTCLFNENVKIQNEPFDNKNENSQMNLSQEYFINNNFVNILKEDLSFNSFKCGINEDNFYEEISQIISKGLQNNQPFDLEHISKTPSVERPKNPFYKNVVEEEDNDDEEDLEAELNKIQI